MQKQVKSNTPWLLTKQKIRVSWQDRNSCVQGAKCVKGQVCVCVCSCVEQEIPSGGEWGLCFGHALCCWSFFFLFFFTFMHTCRHTQAHTHSQMHVCYKNEDTHTHTHSPWLHAQFLWGWLEQETSHPHTKGGKSCCLPCTLFVLAVGGRWRAKVIKPPSTCLSTLPPTPSPLTPSAYTHTSCQSPFTVLPNTCSTYNLWNKLLHWCIGPLQHAWATCRNTDSSAGPRLKFQHQLYLSAKVFIDTSGAYLCGLYALHLNSPHISQDIYPMWWIPQEWLSSKCLFRAETWESGPNTAG